MNAGEVLRSPDGKIEVKLLNDKDKVSYSVSLNGEAIIGPSDLGLKSDAATALEIIEVTRTSADIGLGIGLGRTKNTSRHLQ